MLVKVVFLSNSSLRESEFYRSTLVYLTKLNKNCPLFTENYVELYQLSRHTNATLSDHHFASTSFVIIPNSLSMGTQRKTIASLFSISGDYYKIPEPEDNLDARLEFGLSRYSQQKRHDRRISTAPVATQTHFARY